MGKQILKQRLRDNVKLNKNDCWEWQGATNRKKHGYGMINVGVHYDGVKRTMTTHKLSYLLFNGEIKENQCVLHNCDNPKCINPGHLFLGTQEDNLKDMVSKERQGENRKGFIRTVKIEDVITIRSLYKKGKLGYKKLAKMFNVKNKNTIKDIVKNKTYKSVSV